MVHKAGTKHLDVSLVLYDWSSAHGMKGPSKGNTEVSCTNKSTCRLVASLHGEFLTTRMESSILGNYCSSSLDYSPVSGAYSSAGGCPILP